jgi:hypothetical protein
VALDGPFAGVKGIHGSLCFFPPSIFSTISFQISDHTAKRGKRDLGLETENELERDEIPTTRDERRDVDIFYSCWQISLS